MDHGSCRGKRVTDLLLGPSRFSSRNEIRELETSLASQPKSRDFAILVFRSEFSRIQSLLRAERNQAEVPLRGLKRLSHVLQSDRSTVVEGVARRIDPTAQRLFGGQRDLVDPQQLVADRCRPALRNAIPARDPNLAQDRNLAARIVDTIAKTENRG